MVKKRRWQRRGGTKLTNHHRHIRFIAQFPKWLMKDRITYNYAVIKHAFLSLCHSVVFNANDQFNGWWKIVVLSEHPAFQHFARNAIRKIELNAKRNHVSAAAVTTVSL